VVGVGEPAAAEEVGDGVVGEGGPHGVLHRPDGVGADGLSRGGPDPPGQLHEDVDELVLLAVQVP